MKVLIIKLSALGDVLAPTPFFRLLKNQNPDWEVHHLVMRHCTSVTKNNPWVDRQVVLDLVPSGNWANDFRNLSGLWLRLFRERYDLAILFHRNFLFQLLCKLARIPYLVGFRSTWNGFLDHMLTYDVALNRTLQEYQLLREGSIDLPEPDRLEFYPDEQQIDINKLHSLPGRYIACNPGGGNLHTSAKNRMWPIERYAQWIDQCSLPVVVLGHGERDQQLHEKLKTLAKNNYINFVNGTNLHETAIILRRSCLYVGNDSALLYLAAAMNTPTLGLFGPTQRIAANPLGPRQHYLVGSAPCSPCYNPHDGVNGMMYICRNNVCMQNLTVKEVVQQVEVLLKTP